MHLNNDTSDLERRTGRSADDDVSCRKNQVEVLAHNFLPVVALMFKLLLTLFKCMYAFEFLCPCFSI